MSHTKEVCCLCLDFLSTPLIDMFSEIEDKRTTYFDKICSTLSKLATILNDNIEYHYMLCNKCCTTIETVYSFNIMCLDNVKKFISKNEKTGDDNGKKNEQSVNKVETSFIKKEIEEDIPNLMDFCQVELTEAGDYKTLNKTNFPIQETVQADEYFGDKKRHSCKVCKRRFRKKSNFDNHICDKPYKCNLCERSFNLVGHLERHMVVHSTEKPYLCDVCNTSFKQKATLDQHKLIHSGEKPHICYLCEKPFRHKSDLIAHIRRHTGDKKHECETCKKLFVTKSHLTRHLRVHTGERPYTCEICNKSFTQRRNLNVHLQQIHKE